MKTNLHLLSFRKILWAATVVGLALSTTIQAATNAPAGGVIRSDSSILKGVHVYSMKFPGGTVSDFFGFMRANGFAKDTILFAGKAGEVYLPEFTVSHVQLKEVAKSMEFVAEGKLVVELVELPEAGDANVWRIRLAEPVASGQLRTRACAVRHLLAGPKSKDRVDAIVEAVYRALIEGAHDVRGNDAQRPRGRITILESERIVVAVGMEAYVEAVSSALEAAERVAAASAAEKQ